MSIATAIQNAQQKVKNAYTAVSNKGGTLPTTQDLSNLPSAIDSIETGSTPVIQLLEVTPSTSQQSIVAPSGVDGYSPVTVEAVTYTIDSNIQSENILSGVNILGVTGSVVASNETSLSITPTTSSQSFSPYSPYTGYDSVSVSAVTSSIDNNIVAGNIKDGVTILGVTGSYEGFVPSGTISITSNGTYDVTNYANASVNVSGGGGYSELPSYQVSSGIASRRSGALTGNEFSNITSIDDLGLYSSFYHCANLVGVINFSSLTTVGEASLYNAFRECTGLTGVDLSSLSNVDNYGLFGSFYGCTGINGSLDLSSLTDIGNNGLNYTFSKCYGLTSIDLSSLETVGSNGLENSFQNCTGINGSLDLSSLKTAGSNGIRYAFSGCVGITSVDLSSLTSIGNAGLQNAFNGCSSLESVNLSSLITVGSYGFSATFGYCSNLENIYFNSLRTTSFDNVNAFNFMMSDTGSSVVHTIHFPSNLETTIQGLTGYPLFGGTSGYVVLAFDLPATS